MINRLANNCEQLGFFGIDEILGITAAVATASNAGVSAYSTIEQMGIAKKTAGLQADLFKQRANIEKDLAETQKRLLEMQTTYYGEKEELAIEIEKARTELIKEKLKREAAILKEQQEAELLESARKKQEDIHKIKYAPEKRNDTIQVESVSANFDEPYNKKFLKYLIYSILLGLPILFVIYKLQSK